MRNKKPIKSEVRINDVLALHVYTSSTMLALFLGLMAIGEKWLEESSGSGTGGMELVDEDWDEAETPIERTERSEVMLLLLLLSPPATSSGPINNEITL